VFDPPVLSALAVGGLVASTAVVVGDGLVTGAFVVAIEVVGPLVVGTAVAGATVVRNGVVSGAGDAEVTRNRVTPLPTVMVKGAASNARSTAAASSSVTSSINTIVATIDPSDRVHVPISLEETTPDRATRSPI